ncbi:hypothetical protein D3C87_1030900 [compost metagenome]
MAKTKFADLNDEPAVAEIKRVMGESDFMKVSAIAKALRTKRQNVLDVVESACDPELDLIVGVRCGGGIGEFKESEYEIEYIRPEAA